tara:strand:- start:1599 stop:2159 length:561 start_codon:yes stop_codon:yes gene_type:complete
MIKVLKNPKTDHYLELKKFILSKEFPWRYNISTNMEFYSHVFLQRPELSGYTESHSKWTNENFIVMGEIIDYNGLYKDIPYFFLRSNANATHPDSGRQYSDPHVDHPHTPHSNLIVYLTDTDGDTIVENSRHSPKEDDVVLFTGEHYMQRPTKGRRVILISTIFGEPGEPGEPKSSPKNYKPAYYH